MKTLRTNALLKVLSLNSVSVGINFVVGIFSAKAISVFLGPPGMALLGSFRNFGTMVKSVATLGINNSVVRLFVENKDDRQLLSRVYSTYFWLFLAVSSVLAAVLFAAASSISNLLFYTESYATAIRFFGLLLPLMAVNAFWIAVYNGLARFKTIVIIQIVSNVLVFAATILLIWQRHIPGGMLAMGVGELLMFLVTFVYVRKDRAHFHFRLTATIDSGYLGVIGKFSVMALLSAVLVPGTLLWVRNDMIGQFGIDQGGVWDAVNRLSGFYMTLFSSGLSLYYMPKLASLSTDAEFKDELQSYFKTFLPLFVLMLIGIYLFRGLILKIAFTPEFAPVKDLLAWQMCGDLIKMATLAFGFQILVKTKLRDYFMIEIVFNLSYLLFSFYLIRMHSIAGALQAYVGAGAVTLVLVLWIFRKVIFKNHATR